MSERISEERLAELHDMAVMSPYSSSGIRNDELRSLIATARRERVLAEQVRVLAKHVQDHHAVYDAGDNDDMGPLWDNLASSKNELDDMLATHKTTLAKLAEGGLE